MPYYPYSQFNVFLIGLRMKNTGADSLKYFKT